MERDEKIVKIKQDLRLMRKLRHCINSTLGVFEDCEKMLIVVNGSQRLSESERISIKADIHTTVEKLSVEQQIKQLAELEMRYAPVISKLDSTDRTIITEAFLKGKTYKNIGQLMYYSSESIKKRVNKILLKFAENL